MRTTRGTLDQCDHNECDTVCTLNPYIQSMSGSIQRARGYGQDNFELVVSVSFDAKQFSQIKKKQDPLAYAMAQIKNVVLDATGVRGTPGYSPVAYKQRFPRASKGTVTLKLYFDVPDHVLKALHVDTKQWSLYHTVELNETLERTRDDGHLFAKSALAAVTGN